MSKFRRLTIEELELLESDFIDFLVVNGITAGDWKKIKHKNPENADVLLGGFSDVIFAGILRKVKYLEHLSAKSLKLFCLENEHIALTGLDLKSGTGLRFPENGNIVEFIEKNASEIEIYRSEKAYSNDMLLEIYNMMEGGCIKTEGELYKFFNPLV
ncbi:MAG: hypothetical protein IPM42_20355 [Saprospiraceae bacterium]|nr:hypothetical protein [Saprospiraceae bacterium]